jgi:hypothetical protein
MVILEKGSVCGNLSILIKNVFFQAQKYTGVCRCESMRKKLSLGGYAGKIKGIL